MSYSFKERPSPFGSGSECKNDGECDGLRRCTFPGIGGRFGFAKTCTGEARRAGPNGEPAFYWTWTAVPGVAPTLFPAGNSAIKHVSVSVNGSVWAIRWDGAIFRGDVDNPGSWTLIAGQLKMVSAGGDNVWGVNDAGDIYYTTNKGGNWNRANGNLSWISVAADGTLYGVQGGGSIFRGHVSKPGVWEQVPGGLKMVSVADRTHVWGVNAQNEVFRFKADVDPASNTKCCWNRMIQPCSTESDCDGGGEGCKITGAPTKQYGPFACNTCENQGQMYDRGSSTCKPYPGGTARFTGASASPWERVNGQLTAVEAAQDGTVWGVDGAKTIWRLTDTCLPGACWAIGNGLAAQVSVASADLVFGVGANMQPMR